MNKNTVYILQKDYEYPNGKVYKGVGHTIKEWQRYFPYLIGRDFDIKTDWFKPKEEPKKLDKEKEFQKVLKCLKNNKVVVDTREDGIYTRLAGRESDGEAFTLHFALAYPFPKGKPKEEVNESKPTEQFQWTNELVMEFVNFHDEQKGIHWLSEDIEKFKQSKSKKEEPQWEILEIESYGGLSYPLIDGEYRLYTDGVGFTATYLLQRSDSKIKTVKRLSDNTVWSVGQLTEHGKISAFRIGGGIMTADITDSKYPLTFLYLSQLQAPKEEQVPHRCKYCNALVTSDSDEGCYANPNRINEDIGSEEKQEEQVPIKVESIAFYTSFGEKQIRDTFAVNLSNNISEDKLQQIKSAIERELNNYKDERPVPYASYKHLFDQHQELLSEFSKMHTSEELLQARRDAFDAAREGELDYSITRNPISLSDAQYIYKNKYKDNEDYINSLK